MPNRKDRVGFFYLYVLMVVLGCGVVVANLVSLSLMGRMASPPAMVGGLLVVALSTYRIARGEKVKED